MNPLEKKDTSENMAEEIQNALIRQNRNASLSHELNNMATVWDFLRTCGFSPILAKTSRRQNDSYIFRIKESDIAIKIHPDIFYNCRRIYCSSEAMRQLMDAGDINHIYRTFTVGQFRIVIYRWQNGDVPGDLIKSGGVNEIRHMLRARVRSLTQKGFSFNGGHEDALIHTGELVILDPNHLGRTRMISHEIELQGITTERTDLIYNKWLAQILSQKKESRKKEHK